MVQLLTWVGEQPRVYREAIEAWRSSCPRHPVWDDALISGFIQFDRGASARETRVILTSRGREFLEAARSAS